MPKLAQSAAPQETAQLAARFAPLLTAPLRIYLSGELGAGKTFWVQALLRELGEIGRIPSPSYALVYSYRLSGLTVHHFDCYRLQGAPIGDDLLELLEEQALCLLEWYEQASGLPPADLYLRFEITGAEHRDIEARAASDKGRTLLRQLT